LRQRGRQNSVHVKILRSQKLRMLLTHRKLLQSTVIALAVADNPLCALFVERFNAREDRSRKN
jgi:hypothetical protein